MTKSVWIWLCKSGHVHTGRVLASKLHVLATSTATVAVLSLTETPASLDVIVLEVACQDTSALAPFASPLTEISDDNMSVRHVL